MRDGFVNYEDWEKGLPQTITNDPLWHVQSYRLSLFVADISWRDVTKLSQDYRTRSLSDQLYRAIGSALILLRDIVENQTRIKLDFMNMRLVLRVKDEIGISKQDIFWAKTLWSIVLIY